MIEGLDLGGERGFCLRLLELLEEGAIIMGVYPNPMQTSGNVHYLLQNPTELSIVIFNNNGTAVRANNIDGNTIAIYIQSNQCGYCYKQFARKLRLCAEKSTYHHILY